MNVNINFLRKCLVIPFVILITQSTAFAEPLLIPGFLGIESSYIETPEADSNTTNAYFTIINLHNQPIRLLNTNSDFFGSAVFHAANGEELEYIEVLPRERVVMEPGGIYIQLNEITDSITAADSTHEVTLLVRRGREAMEFVEEYFDNSERELRGGGIPNEKEFLAHISVRD
ncbi:MAG: hypothetical protein COA71_08390 [SAR86 cluster bacterium]|uniref:Copper chaperone PCu(A)C n=1 Tax=SAR86 cluster bacterium TaxID=2030880 RepID=A0A2A5CCF6_9GAMM|nr:MAG: hypothetical protein COA71_08390 [SAR86 cluster bacterium]